MDIPEQVLPAREIVRDWGLSLAVQVADIDRQAEEWMLHALPKRGVAIHGINEHPRLRLEREAHAGCGRIIAQAPAAFRQSLPKDGFRLCGIRRSGPKAHPVRA